MMGVFSYKVGYGCKWMGMWLLATAALLVYGETAPSVAAPDFTFATLCLAGGGILFSVGCMACTRRQRAIARR